MSAANDVQVSLVDEDEDLLEYDDSVDGEESDRAGRGSNEDVEVGLVSDDKAREAAEMLLKKTPPCIRVSYGEDSFLLFDCGDEEDEAATMPIICENDVEMHASCNGLFTAVRRFLEKFYGGLPFLSKELLLDIPCLDITLCEDNAYNNQITFEDIATIFSILKERSESNSEPNVPRNMEIKISVRPRFVSRYNALVELTQSTASLGNIRPFTNDKSHPVVLDDSNPAFGSADQPVVMNIDEEENEGHDAEAKERVESLNEPQDREIENDSDELLEIVDEVESESDTAS